MKQTDKGFSLVELIVALAVFSIVGVAVFGFMVNSTNIYSRMNTDIKLQYEQQLAVNQIRDMVVESDKGIYFDETSKTLALYGAAKTESGGTVYPVMVISYNQAEEKLYLGTKDFAPGSEITFADVTDLKLLAENVTDFNVDLTNVKKNKVVFRITFRIGDKTQTVKETVALRNTLVVSNQVDTVWGGEEVRVESFIKGITICRDDTEFATGDSDVIGKYGDSVVVIYTAKVTAYAQSSREYAVSWSMEENMEGIAVSDSGAVTINSSVLNGTTFTLRATSVDDPAKSTYITIEVADSAVYPDHAKLELSGYEEHNGYITYKLLPTLYYTNGSYVADYSRFTWIGLDSLPSGCSFDKETGELILQSTANGYSFTVQVKANARTATGEEIVSDELIISANNIPQYVAKASVEIAVASSLSRGGGIYPSMVFKNSGSSDYTYSWKIEPYYDEESAKWGDFDNSGFDLVSLAEAGNYDAEKVQHTLTTDENHRSVVLNCAPQLNWSKAFKLVISGTAMDKKGNVLTTESKVVSIMPVEITLTPTDNAALYAGAENLLAESTLCYENWDEENKKQDCVTRRCFTINCANLNITNTDKLGCTYQHNYLIKDAKGFQAKYKNAQMPIGIFDENGMLCGFEKKLYEWEKNVVPLPVYMNYTFTLKDKYGNSKSSNVQAYSIVYEFMNE